MNMITPLRRFLIAGGFCALALTSRAQVIELRATINAAQETPTPSTSPATGSAIMLYDVAANTFDLIVSIINMSNPATASHIQEAAPGVNGPVVTGLGADAVYTRSGNTLKATFRGVTHAGDKLKLIQGGAYFNIHSAQFPGGEVRGQLIPRPVRLVSNLDVAQDQAAFPAVNLAGLNDSGAVVIFYDPVTKMINLRSSIYNFNNPFTNSHFHEGAPGVSGPVVHALGNLTVYNTANGVIAGSFDTPYLGNPLTLLTGGAYLNYHSSTFPGGELRGQIRVSNEIATTRFSNLSVRGFVGTGEQVLIQGITVNGPDPIRALITAKGPSLSAFGITGALPNPRVALYDSGGRQIAFNGDIGTVVAGSDLARLPGVPTNTVEAALLVVLPPGNYTAVVSADSGTGIALLEVTDVRNFLGLFTAASTDASMVLLRERAAAPRSVSMASAAAKAVLELCAGVPLTVAVAQR